MRSLSNLSQKTEVIRFFACTSLLLVLVVWANYTPVLHWQQHYMAKSMWILEHYIQHIIFCYKGILFSRSSFPQDLGSWLQGFCWHSAIGALAKEDQWWWAIRSGITAYPKDGGQGSLQAIKVLRKLRRSISLFTLCTVALNVLQKYYLYLKIIKEMEFVDMMTMLVMASFRTSGTVGWDQNFKSLYCNPI